MLAGNLSRRMGTVGVLAVLLAAIAIAQAPASAQDGYQPTVMITGSNRGIGFEFAEQYASQRWRVVATARSPDRAENLRALAEALVQEFVATANTPSAEAFERGDVEEAVRIFIDGVLGAGAYENLDSGIRANLMQNARELEGASMDENLFPHSFVRTRMM